MNLLALSFYKTEYRLRDRFSALNQRGFATAVLAAVSASALTAYFVLLFWTMHAGFSLEKISAERALLKEGVLRLEMAMRDGSHGRAFMEETHSRMEEVSSVTYLLSEGVASLDPDFHP